MTPLWKRVARGLRHERETGHQSYVGAELRLARALGCDVYGLKRMMRPLYRRRPARAVLARLERRSSSWPGGAILASEWL